MIFTDRGASIVRIADLDGSNLQTLIPSAGTNVRGIAIDLTTDDLFYADNGANIIYRARLNGSERAAIVSTDLNFPADLALDRGAAKLYWCDRDNNRIERANYDGTGRESLIATSQPYFLDLDLTNQKIYWGDYAGGNIFRADLPDGTNVETVVSGLVQTRGVKIDPGGGYLYWCDRNASKVQRRSIDSGPIEDLYTGLDTPHGLTLDIPAGKVYWCDTGTNLLDGSGAMAVNRGNMDGSGPQEVLANVDEPWDITLDKRTATYPEWVARRFQMNALPSVADPDADPDRDQHSNLLEYFADLNPFTSQGLQPTGILWIDEDFLFTYRQTFETITDVQASVEVSTDLITWNSGPTFTQPLDTNNADGALFVTHKLLPDAVDPGGTYLRLRLELIDP
ncbi:MAG: hypothetical protein O7C75_13475 [Verrucomicrobia bacterium]|nr:hypothetical protein [Verrucomicrobiota bacterium]